jgi:prolyl 4-hydroxylase
MHIIFITKILHVIVEGEWERSTDAGSTNEYGETGRIMSSSRTSSNAWCQGRCDSNHHVKNIYSKMEEIVGIPRENYESLQVTLII